MMYFQYTDEELKMLVAKDETLGKFIEKRGHISREINPNLFDCLINSIVSQQISTKAAATVFARLTNLLTTVTAQNIVNADKDEMQKCGLSFRKVAYLKGIGEACVKNEIDFDKLSLCTNDEFILTLSKLNGIGVWTCEMLLIFCLNRKDVLSFGDLAIKKGILKLYNLNSITKKEFEFYKKLYSPFCSIASLYLWEISALD